MLLLLIVLGSHLAQKVGREKCREELASIIWLSYASKCFQIELMVCRHLENDWSISKWLRCIDFFFLVKKKKLREWMWFGPPPIPIRVLCSSHCSGGNVLKVHLCVSDSHFFSVNEVLGHRKATPSHNQQFHSTANPQQPEVYQHCEALAPKSATAVAAMWEFVTAGCVWLGIFFRLWHSWCDVCFILGRWCGELSV